MGGESLIQFGYKQEVGGVLWVWRGGCVKCVGGGRGMKHRQLLGGWMGGESLIQFGYRQEVGGVCAQMLLARVS